MYLERTGGGTGHHTEHSSFHCGKPIPRLAHTLTPAILVIATQFGLLDRSAEDSSGEQAILQRVIRQGGLRPPPSSSRARQDTEASSTPTGDSTPPPPVPSEEGGAAIASLRAQGPSAPHSLRHAHTRQLALRALRPPSPTGDRSRFPPASHSLPPVSGRHAHSPLWPGVCGARVLS